jgi:hypothetical protein
MVVIERLGPDKLGPAKSGPEKFAPPDRRAPEKRSEVEHIAFLHRQSSEVDPAIHPTGDNPNAQIQRVAADSMEEIDRVIRELESVRAMLRNEAERVSREVAGYASLNHAAMTAMKVIGDSVRQWKDSTDASGPRSIS